MNFPKFLFLLLIGITSCSRKEVKNDTQNLNDSIFVYSEEQLYKTKSKKIKVKDTNCIYQQRRAKNDIKNQNLKYTLIYGFGMYDYSNKEFSELLSNYSIKLDSVMKPCDGPTKGFRWFCYEETMNTEIERRFGLKFIDSLRAIADKQFIQRHPYLVLHWSECETTSRYSRAKTYDEFLTLPESDFVATLNYPKMNKRQQSKQKANTMVSFVIYRDGTVGDIETESDFKIATNIEFAKYFEKKAIEFVKTAKWKAAEYRGLNVNSKMDLNLYNK